ncbi:MAG: OmpP1/FadL family transporter [bacterium]
MKKCFIILTVFSLVLILAAGTAFAGAFRIPESGAAAMAQGNAFVGQADDPSAVHHNPGAITGLEGNQFMSGLNIISPESEFEGVDMKKETFYVPYLFYTNHLGEGDWWLGFGVNAPFGLGTEWDSSAAFNAFFRGITPLNPVDIVTKTSLEIVKISPVAAYRVNDNFSVGFGPEYYYVKEVIYNGGSSDGAGTGWEYTMDGDGNGLGFTFGSLYQATDALRIGFSYHSGVTAELSGDAAGLPETSGAPYTGKASVDLNIPDTYAVGINYRASEKFSFNVDLDFTQWSDYDKLVFKRPDGSVIRTITKNYEDVMATRLGGSYYVDNNWTVRVGYFTEPTPVPESTFDPRLPDADATAISVGAGYDAGSWATNFAYMAVSKDDRDVNSDEPNPLIDTIYDGVYKTSIRLISADVTFRF